MAEAHHDDHGNTPAAWFLTVSWITVWTVGAAAIILGNSLIWWSLATLGLSAMCAAIAGLMKRAGLGRKSPRVAPSVPERAEQSEARPQEVNA